jgi:hypothetical protein
MCTDRYAIEAKLPNRVRSRCLLLERALLVLALAVPHQAVAQIAAGCLRPGETRISAPAEWPAPLEERFCPVSSIVNRGWVSQPLTTNDDISCGKVVGAFTLIGAGQGGIVGFATMVAYDGVIALASAHRRFRVFTRDQAVAAAVGTTTFAIGAPLGAYVGCSDRKARGIPILRSLDSGSSCPQRRGLDLLGGSVLGAGLGLGVVSSVEISFRSEAAGSASGAHVWRDVGLALIPTIPAGIALGNVAWSRCLLTRFSRGR